MFKYRLIVLIITHTARSYINAKEQTLPGR
jgi:hypothetical protein